MEFLELREQDIDKLIAWSRHESIRTRITIDDRRAYYKYVNERDDYFLFGIWENETLIGELAAEFGAEYTYISLAIDPARQSQGLGPRALNHFCGHVHECLCPAPGVVCAAIDPDNNRSIRCFEKAGFMKTGVDKDGNLTYTRLALNI